MMYYHGKRVSRTESSHRKLLGLWLRLQCRSSSCGYHQSTSGLRLLYKIPPSHRHATSGHRCLHPLENRSKRLGTMGSVITISTHETPLWNEITMKPPACSAQTVRLSSRLDPSYSEDQTSTCHLRTRVPRPHLVW